MFSRSMSVFLCLALGTTAQAALPLTQASTRLSLVSLGIRGAYEDIRSYWDVGVKKTVDAEGKVACEILAPRPDTKAAKESWAPFDFYTNITKTEKENGTDAKYILGEPDVFFRGDNDNRNATTQSHEWTRVVTDSFRGSLSFLDRKVAKDAFSFTLAFDRGKISYKGLVQVKTWAADDDCKSAALHCTDIIEKNEKLACEEAGWTRRLIQIVAKADKIASVFDFRVKDEKKKNDVAEIIGVFQDVDENGRDMGKEYEEVLATK